jgi:hypothetical protein
LFGQETRHSIEVLGPLFNGINKKGAEKTIWEELDSVDVYLEADQVIDYQV